MAFIIDKLNKYANNNNVRHTFLWGDSVYGVREVELDKTGEPQFPERDFDAIDGQYCIYTTFEEALQFIQELRQQ